MIKKIFTQRIAVSLILICIALISHFGISKIAMSPKTYAHTIETLDNKKATVAGLSATAITASAATAAIPGDATTPIANEIANISSYLMIIVCVIFLEKCLLSIAGFATFKILIPISCGLFAVYLFKKHKKIKEFAIKLIVFGIAIVTIVPVSTQVSNLIDDTIKLEETVDVAKQSEKELTSAAESLPSEKNGFLDFIDDITDSLKNGLNKATETAKNALNHFIDAVAALIITSCVIPILVLLFFIWIAKIIFELKIEKPKKMFKFTPYKNKKEDTETENV